MGRQGGSRIVEPVDLGIAELVPDPDRPSGWTLLVDGTPQSYMDLSDPTWLEFDYMRHLAAIVDTAPGDDTAADRPGPARQGPRVLHLGGGALTLPRYVAATRPHAVQRVVERDAALIDLVRRMLPLPRGANLRVRAGDGRRVVEESRPAQYDVVVTDVFGGARMPSQFTTVEFVTAVARVLRPGGRYAVNLADGPPLAFARGQVATLSAVFGTVCLLAEPGVLRGRRFGNLVLAGADPRTASHHAGAGRHSGLPLPELARLAAGSPFPARLVAGEELVRFAAGARPVTDARAADSPPPPHDIFSGARGPAKARPRRN
jgi:Spermine/spermidine synthase domain